MTIEIFIADIKHTRFIFILFPRMFTCSHGLFRYILAIDSTTVVLDHFILGQELEQCSWAYWFMWNKCYRAKIQSIHITHCSILVYCTYIEKQSLDNYYRRNILRHESSRMYLGVLAVLNNELSPRSCSNSTIATLHSYRWASLIY